MNAVSVKNIIDTIAITTEAKVTATAEARAFLKLLVNPVNLDGRSRRAYLNKLDEASYDAHRASVERIRLTAKYPKGINLEDYTADYHWFTVYEAEDMDVWVLRDPADVCKMM